MHFLFTVVVVGVDGDVVIHNRNYSRRINSFVPGFIVLLALKVRRFFNDIVGNIRQKYDILRMHLSINSFTDF